jgi:hypothetical protein
MSATHSDVALEEFRGKLAKLKAGEKVDDANIQSEIAMLEGVIRTLQTHAEALRSRRQNRLWGDDSEDWEAHPIKRSRNASRDIEWVDPHAVDLRR